MAKMKVVYRKISELKHPAYNPRTISEEDFKALKKSLENFDAVEPAVVNMKPKRKNIIIGGNQRIRAAKELGLKEFPCVEVQLEEKLEKELNVRLNRNTGKFDYELLANEFDPEDLLSYGFDKVELGLDVSTDVGDVGGMPEPDTDTITIIPAPGADITQSILDRVEEIAKALDGTYKLKRRS